MGEKTQMRLEIEEDTEHTLDMIERALPEDAAIPPMGLLHALYASDVEYTNEVANHGIDLTFQELIDGENMSMFADDGDESPLKELHTNTDEFEYPVESIEFETDVNKQPQTVLLDSIYNSWDLIGKTDELLVDYHAASTPYLHSSNPVLSVIPSAIMDGDDTRMIEPVFQVRALVLSCLQIYSDIEKSTFSDREGVIYHLSKRYNTEEIASIVEVVFGGSPSSGSVRKSISRIKDKINQANFMTDTFTENVGSELQLSSQPTSLLSDDQLGQVSKFITGVLNSQMDSNREKTWELGEAGGVLLSIAVMPHRNNIRLSLYCDIDRLPSPVVIDVNEYGNSEMLMDKAGNDQLPSFSSLSNEFAVTMDDIRLAVERALRDSGYLMVGPHLIDPVSTEAHDRSDSGESGFVNFTQYVEIQPN